MKKEIQEITELVRTAWWNFEISDETAEFWESNADKLK